MTVKELAASLNLSFLTCEELGSEREIKGCYCGDLLSWVMANSKEGNAWLTIMGNINAIGVAVLGDLSCIILTESASLDEEAKNKAIEQEVVVLRTDKSTYQTACDISKLI